MYMITSFSRIASIVRGLTIGAPLTNRAKVVVVCNSIYGCVVSLHSVYGLKIRFERAPALGTAYPPNV
jgi:hypothetical protein